MANFDTSTPQLKFVKRLMDAYITCDISNVELLISKQFQHEPLPESTEFHKEAKEGHVQKWGRVLSLVKKLELTYHEVIEAPGKVILHLSPALSPLYGAPLSYEAVFIITLVKEDGELKVLHLKTFADSQKRSALMAEVIKIAAEKAAA